MRGRGHRRGGGGGDGAQKRDPPPVCSFRNVGDRGEL